MDGFDWYEEKAKGRCYYKKNGVLVSVCMIGNYVHVVAIGERESTDERILNPSREKAKRRYEMIITKMEEEGWMET